MALRHALRNCVTLDFETCAILPRPNYPPRPVGLAIRYPDGESQYYAWGHPTGNTCSQDYITEWLRGLWREEDTPILFFNAKFDLAVCYEILGLPELPWWRVHDAMFLAFLADPHAQSLGLKQQAEDLLDWPPEEQDAIAEYVWTHRKGLVAKYGGKINKRSGKQEASNAGAWISKCPADLVRPYAMGDVDRTYGLFEHLYPLIVHNGMSAAYDRERRALPIFMENERIGIRTDYARLEKEVPKLHRSLNRADAWIRELLDAPDLNINADTDLAEALTDAGVVDEEDWIYTAPTQRHPEGVKSVAKDNLTFDMFKDPDVGHLLFYRNKMQTALSIFLDPWLEQGSHRDGYISTNWNQIRGATRGTRTGRPSTNAPNFLNIPKEFKQQYDMAPDNEWGLEPLPFARSFILPDKGETFIHRDFDGQEMRVFAHYEDGSFLKFYQDNINFAPHAYVKNKIYEIFGEEFEKNKVKAVNFQRLYGGGIPSLQMALGCDRKEAQAFRQMHDEVMPGLEKVNKAIEEIIREGEPIRTWGGRLYFPEPPKIRKGRRQTFVYKLINYLCQGSAADITKEALIKWWDHPERNARFLVTVYDEINISAPSRVAGQQNDVLRDVMESIELDLTMKSSGKMGPSWGDLQPCD